MDVILRPVNDQFLEEIAFPIFEMGMVDAVTALDRLARAVDDERIQTLVELLHHRGIGRTAFFELDADAWLEAMYRLLFSEWTRGPRGWRTGPALSGFACDWMDAVHLALMIEHPRYPYWEPADSEMLREACVARPEPDLGLAALLTGGWDPFPRFIPHEVLRLSERGEYEKGDQRAVADWTVRSREAVALWSKQLPGKLGRLIRREQTRLKPLEIPEADQVLAYWLGDAPEPPLVGVAYSGLGPKATRWVRDIGAIAHQVRAAAAADRGLSAIITRPSRQVDHPFGP